MILSWIHSTLTPEIMGQIVRYQTSHATWIALEKIFSTSSKAWIMQLRLEFQIVRKGSLSMMEYILKIKNISDNLATIGEPINERDQILQLLGGLCAILASLTTREDNISFQSIHSILLTHEQRLCFQNTITPETDIISANMATAHHQNNNNKRINTIDNISQNKNSFAQRSGRPPPAFGNHSPGSHNNPTYNHP